MCRHSLREVLDAPNVMNLIKDTKAAQEVPSKPNQYLSFTFLFATTEKFPYYVYLFSIERGLSFILYFPSGSSYEGFLQHAFKCQVLFFEMHLFYLAYFYD